MCELDSGREKKQPAGMLATELQLGTLSLVYLLDRNKRTICMFR